MVGYEYNLMRATSNHGHVGSEWYANPNVGEFGSPVVALSNHGHVGNEPYAQKNVGYSAMYAPGTVLGYSKDGFPIRAAAVGDVLGYSKDGYPIRAASFIDDAVCGGSQILFIAVGLGLGFLVADKFAGYMATKR